MDHRANFVNDKEKGIRIARTAVVWIDVYVVPSFPPRMFDIVNATMKIQKKIYEQCKNRTTLKAKEPAEKLYFEQLRKADKQVIEYYPILVHYHDLLKSAKSLFIDISNKPSEAKVLKLKPILGKLAIDFKELSKWCDDRAKSWPSFVDATELYKAYREKKKNLLERYGPLVLWEILLAGVTQVLTGGNIAYSTAFPIIAKFGFDGFKQIMSFRWQARALRKQAKIYSRFSKRTTNLLNLYDMPLKAGFLRA